MRFKRFAASLAACALILGTSAAGLVYAVGGLTDDGKGNFKLSGTLSGQRSPIIAASSGTTVLRADQSGSTVANTGTASTTTFTLPVARAGLSFCFVENGDAAGELLINPGTGISIVGKTHGAENGTAIATTAGTGIKNTAATNVRGDHACLTAYNATTWVMTSVAGVWASQ